MAISVLAWVLVGGVVWLAVAVAVALVLGRMIRLRDRVPHPAAEEPSAGSPMGTERRSGGSTPPRYRPMSVDDPSRPA